MSSIKRFITKNRTFVALTVAVFAACIVSVTSTLRSNAAPSNLPSGFSATMLINHSMTAPTSVRVAPDGRIFVFDLFGSIKLFNPGVGFSSQNFGSVSVNATGDKGLLGAAFDSDFANNPYVYIHYVGTDDKVRIGRFDASSNIGTNFTVLYTAPVASGFQHAGGGITVGLDGYVYFGIGDSGTPTNSQNLTINHGKIHRIYRDGTVPVNPFSGQSGVPNTIYAYGVRNPFRLTTDKLTGSIYIGDVGYNTWEEINLLQPGLNYGWATQEGPCPASCAFENPVYWYPHQFGTNNTNDASIVAGPVYRGSVYPTSYQGKMFISDYVQGFLRTINPATTSSSFSTFSTDNGSVIDMDVGPDGKLYFITIGSPTLYRLDYTSGTVNAPPIANASADTTSGPAPLSVAFSSAGSSDPEGQPLTYSWSFGDGTTSTLQNPTKVYTTNGQYTATLTVSDGVNSTAAQAVTIRVGNQPVVTITSPSTTTTYNGGQTVSYAATAVDGNGLSLPDSSLSTTVRLYHSDHSHPFLGPLAGGSGQITAPQNGELSPDVWLRITVTATDTNGVTGSSFVEIHPNISQITVNTSPAGLNVVLDGSNHVIPPTVQGVVGMTRQIAAPSPQIYQGQQYVFSHWSDSGAQDHTFQFPATTTTYTAYYVPAGSGTTLVNQVTNPSFENGPATLPTDWFFSRYGTNDVAFSTNPDARTGVRSAYMSATSVTTGEGRLYHKAVTVAPSTTHNVQYYYKSNVQMKAVADITLVDNSHRYVWLGISQPSAQWNQQNWTFTTPVNAKNVVVSMYLTTAGFVQIDDFALLAPVLGPPTEVQPTITLSATPNTITSGQSSQIQWSVAGTTATCSASGGWTGSMAMSGTQTVTPTATTSYTLSCTNGAGSDTKTVTIVVNPGVPGTTTNLVPNPSIEDHTPSDTPAEWRSSRWGVNTTTFTHAHGGAYDQDHSLRADVTAHTSGEASWSFTPQNILPSTTYTFSQFVKSSGPTKVLAEITLTNGSKQYMWLGSLPTTANWTEFKKTLTTPATAQKITIGTFMTGVGYFQIDSVSLTPPITQPVVTLSATPTTLEAGQSTTLAWSVSGSSSNCVASGGWSGSQPASGSQTVTPGATATYTLQCTNAAGTDTKSVTVTVNPPQTSQNLVTNSTLFDTPVGSDVPLGWYTGGWGTNSVQLAKQAVGHTDNASLMVQMTDYVDGDAKWIFEPVTVTGGQTYVFSEWYKSTSPTELVVEFTLADTTKTHLWLGVLDAAADWTAVTRDIPVPPTAVKMTVHHVLKANGTLYIDDVSVTGN